MQYPLYSFTDERLNLQTIEFADLGQLKDIDEGYVV